MTLTDEEIRVKVAEILGVKILRSCGEEDSDHKNPVDDTHNSIGAWCRWCRDCDATKTCSIYGHDRFWRIHNEEENQAPDWPNDERAALQLCDRMHSEGWEPMIQRPSGIWHVQFTHKDSWKPDVHKMPVSASDRSLARAVTLCFLAAHSNE